MTEIFVEDEYQQLRDGFHGTHLSKVGTQKATSIGKSRYCFPMSYFLLIVFPSTHLIFFWGMGDLCQTIFFVVDPRVFEEVYTTLGARFSGIKNVRISGSPGRIGLKNNVTQQHLEAANGDTTKKK